MFFVSRQTGFGYILPQSYPQPNITVTPVPLPRARPFAFLESNQLSVYFLETLDELRMKARLMGGPYYLGEGEASTIAAAWHLGWGVIIDERRATALARQQLGIDRVLDTKVTRMAPWATLVPTTSRGRGREKNTSASTRREPLSTEVRPTIKPATATQKDDP